ncbi:hypothetical protein WN944_009384 [Citrus x changshan-huyou]|uniref:Uncharacterized protein n=1 Tax=Citrus x changshan-huyou TaxID=2935761 RepID=A0AAP0QS09_9ROSI
MQMQWRMDIVLGLFKQKEIQEQSFDEKTNTVTIKVVSCSPEVIRDKLCCKGEGVIKTIEILEPPPSKPPPSTTTTTTPPTSKPKPSPPQAPAPAPVPYLCYPLVRACCRECYEVRGGGPCYSPVRACCTDCSEGRGGGPCYQLGYGRERQYDWCYGRPVYESWGGGCDNRVYYRGRCSDYICEANPAAPCTIM